MKLRTTFLSEGRRFDISISAEANTMVGDLTSHLLASRGGGAPAERLGIAVQPGTADERIVSPSVMLGDAGMVSGDRFTLARVGEDTQQRHEQVATVNVVAGPDLPASHPVHRGSNTLGRGPDCEIRLTDPLVSKRHARIVVSDIIEIVDDSSANGIQVGGRTVDRAILRPGECVTVGDTTLEVTLDVTQLEGVEAGHRDVVFNRSPRVEVIFEGEEIEAPEPPEQVQARRFPIITLIAPLLMAGVIFAVTRNPLSILFVALSPMMVVGSYAEQKYAKKRSLAQATEAFSVALADLRADLEAARSAEIDARLAAHPAAADVMRAVVDRSPMVWTRRPQHDVFLQLRFGVGSAPSRNEVVKPPFGRSVPSLRRDLETLIDEFATTGPVPITVDLRAVGSAGIGGPAPLGPSLRNMVLAQIVGLHSPADVVVAGVISAPSEALEWLKWIPHVHSDFSPLVVDHLASTSTEAAILVGAIEELMATRRANADRPGAAASATNAPAVVLVVDDDAPTDRARLVQIAEHGPEWGVHVVWGAPSVAELPSACQAFIGVDARNASAHAGFVIDHVTVDALVCEQPTPADMVTSPLPSAPPDACLEPARTGSLPHPRAGIT